MPGPCSLPIRYDARELEGLPAPLQGYFRAALKDGQSVITAVTLDMAGTFYMSPTCEQWKPFTSRQRVITRRHGFLWNAKIAMLPGVTLSRRQLHRRILSKKKLESAFLAEKSGH